MMVNWVGIIYTTFILLTTSCSHDFLNKKKEEDIGSTKKIDNSKEALATQTGGGTSAAPSSVEKFPESVLSDNSIREFCSLEMSRLPGAWRSADTDIVCQKVKALPGCLSESKKPIFHYDRMSAFPAQAKRILTMALIHGDELPSGTVARAWMARLEKLNPRNSWRVIPIMNPDGFQMKTRTNARGVDLNRNFPTEGWEGEAVERWKTHTKQDPRRYPGPNPGSEIETRCAMKHIEDFQPDFIISIHTPLGVLDFDGPKLNYPRFEPLPWISLGHYPGSLGRYMWKDHSVPVLTIELKGAGGLKRLEQLDDLQDISGTVAIQASKAKEEKN